MTIDVSENRRDNVLTRLLVYIKLQVVLWELYFATP